jgi:hypothetical protein
MSHADLGHQAMEAFAVRRGTRLAEVAVAITMTRSSAQPSATARWRKPYWRLVLSVFSNTWRSVD